MPLLHQQHRTAAFDFACDPAVHVRRHTGNAPGQNLPALGDKFLQQIGILVVDRFGGDIDAAPGHRAIGPAESRTAFGGLRLHGCLPRFAVKGMPPQERIVFLFFEPIGCARAFLITRAHVARDRLAERFGFRAFESDNLLRHKLVLALVGLGLFFFSFGALFIGQTE